MILQHKKKFKCCKFSIPTICLKITVNFIKLFNTNPHSSELPEFFQSSWNYSSRTASIFLPLDFFSQADLLQLPCFIIQTASYQSCYLTTKTSKNLLGFFSPKDTQHAVHIVQNCLDSLYITIHKGKKKGKAEYRTLFKRLLMYREQEGYCIFLLALNVLILFFQQYGAA